MIRFHPLRIACIAAVLASALAAQMRDPARDRERIETAIRENPAGYQLKLSAPETVEAGGELSIRLDYVQPEAAQSQAPARGYLLEGFLIRGPVSCGAPELPCPVPAAQRDERAREGMRVRMAGQFFVDSGFTGNVAALLPKLQPGEYTIWAVANEVTFAQPGTAGGMQMMVDVSPRKRRLISNAVTLRVAAPAP